MKQEPLVGNPTVGKNNSKYAVLFFSLLVYFRWGKSVKQMGNMIDLSPKPANPWTGPLFHGCSHGHLSKDPWSTYSSRPLWHSSGHAELGTHCPDTCRLCRRSRLRLLPFPRLPPGLQLTHCHRKWIKHLWILSWPWQSWSVLCAQHPRPHTRILRACR